MHINVVFPHLIEMNKFFYCDIKLANLLEKNILKSLETADCIPLIPLRNCNEQGGVKFSAFYIWKTK